MNINSILQRGKRSLQNRTLWQRRAFLMLVDCVFVTVAGLFALVTRFEFVWQNIDPEFIKIYFYHLVPHLITTVVVFWLFHVYHSLWEYASVQEVLNIFTACAISTAIEFLIIVIMGGYLPRSYYPLSLMYSACAVAASRISYRYARDLRNGSQSQNDKNIMIIGAGASGTMITKEITNSKYVNGKVCCMIDDDPQKIGCYIHGIKVVGDRTTIRRYVRKFHIDQIIISMPSASRKVQSEILAICKETDCELKILPGLYQLVNDEVSVQKLRDVEIDDLLGREPIVTDIDAISGYITGKVVLVTGGGGSIGSELCRQISEQMPKQLVIVDIYENNAYDIQQELRRKHPELNLMVLIASVRNTRRMDEIFAAYRPDIVFHAAAHKHVPLMEDSPAEAIKNNVMGTLKTAVAADKYGTKRFILISTDKAVNPTNIMGASKRLCEMVVQTYNKYSKTDFVAVRFGNVLGSNGSVIPLFKKQIENGGPVTVTHPDIIRYFMTIPEAVSLVLTAGAYAKGGEIFVLDMGEPVKIVDLAKNLIRLSGLKLGEDIDIVFTGLRPGEKLYEELLMDEEGLQSTPNHMIHIGKPIEMDDEQFLKDLKVLKRAAEREDKNIRELVKKMVPTYHPEGE